jgi:hypothetical protein
LFGKGSGVETIDAMDEQFMPLLMPILASSETAGS